MRDWQIATDRSFREPLREATVLFLVSCVLGLGYNGLTRKGMFAAASSSSAPSQVAAEPTPAFITYEEAAELYGSGKAIFVDARHEYDYNLGHIKGAINIPLGDFDARPQLISGIQKTSLLVVYCDGAECNSSIDLGRKLAAAGYANVKIFFGGWREWQMHNQPTGE